MLKNIAGILAGFAAGAILFGSITVSSTQESPTPTPTPTRVDAVFPPNPNCQDWNVDINKDCNVSSIDLGLVAQRFGPVPPVAPTDSPTPTYTATNTPVPTATPTPSGETRSKYDWPFAQGSIWNMPIGSGASYVFAGLQDANAWRGEITEDENFITIDPSSPLKNLNGGSTLVHVDPTLSHGGGWNGCATFLNQDNATLNAGQPLNLTAGGNPSWQYDYSSQPGGGRPSLTGDGRWGCHGGSALSGLGGVLRPGELNGTRAIRHALAVNVFAERFLSCSNSGYRWPAFRADGYMNCTSYGGSIPAMRMGSLLAIQPSVNCDTFVSHAWAKRVCHAFQDYGAYVVDDTAWDVHALNTDRKTEWTSDAGFHSDTMKLFRSLYVVDNNAANNIGGGGTPRAPLAPPFSN